MESELVALSVHIFTNLGYDVGIDTGRAKARNCWRSLSGSIDGWAITPYKLKALGVLLNVLTERESDDTLHVKVFAKDVGAVYPV